MDVSVAYTCWKWVKLFVKLEYQRQKREKMVAFNCQVENQKNLTCGIFRAVMSLKVKCLQRWLYKDTKQVMNLAGSFWDFPDTILYRKNQRNPSYFKTKIMFGTNFDDSDNTTRLSTRTKINTTKTDCNFLKQSDLWFAGERSLKILLSVCQLPIFPMVDTSYGDFLLTLL